jgi:signal transduction histidine kinase
VTTVIEQPAGVLWIGTGQKLVRYDITSRQRVEFGAESGLPDRKLSIVATDHDGAIWVGCSSGGLYRARSADSPRFEHVIVPGSDDATIGGIAFDAGLLWVTTGRGLFVRDHGVWRRFTTRDGLRDDGVLFLTVRRNHEVCASYLAPYGLTCLTYAGGAITQLHHIDETTGLSSPVPYFLTEDRAGRLWVGGAQGVSILDGNTVDRFTRASGAPGDDCNANASWVSPSGQVWIGTSSGAGVFDGATYRGALPPPTVQLERGRLGGAEIAIGEPRSVPHDAAHFEVELGALTFVDERHLEFVVRMTGFDDSWHAAEARAARYPRLSAGTYQFAARARYRNATWGPPMTYDFIVEPPLWQTWWFYTACGAAGAIGIALFVRLRSHALVRRNLELEDIVRARTQELVAANAKIVHAEKLSALGRLLAQLSHEINNPLNVIHNNIGPLEEYSQALCVAAERTRALATDPASRARLDELWRELDLDYILSDSAQAFAISKTAIQRVSAIHHELKAFLRGVPPERTPTDLAETVRTTIAMMQRGLPDVAIRCDLDPLPLVRVHATRIQQTLTNLLQNAADSMNQAGQITIRASADHGGVRIRVTDSGPGVPPELRSKIFEPFFTTKDVGKGLGLGLSICREIVVAHGGTLELDESYTGGACFVITLPIG